MNLPFRHEDLALTVFVASEHRLPNFTGHSRLYLAYCARSIRAQQKTTTQDISKYWLGKGRVQFWCARGCIHALKILRSKNPICLRFQTGGKFGFRTNLFLMEVNICNILHRAEKSKFL